MSTFFTSDTHFGHTNIIRYCSRPFASVEQMNDELILRWNSVVKPDDVVYHLGDFAFGRNCAEAAVLAANTLNGVIHLIEGNHEETAKTVIPNRFASIRQYAEIEVEKQHIVLFHYGLRTWHHDLRGVWHLYGHSHNELPAYGKSCDVGVDAWNFFPVSMSTLRQFMSNRGIGKHPQFQSFTGGQDQ